MCGRYTLSRPSELIEELEELFAEEPASDADASRGGNLRTTGCLEPGDCLGAAELPTDLLAPRFNVAPTQVVPTVACSPAHRPRLAAMRWGLRASWSQAAASGGAHARLKAPSKLLINARIETVAQKPSFRDAFAKRRCLVLADGFYEWTSKAAGQQPHLLRLEAEMPSTAAEEQISPEPAVGAKGDASPSWEPFCFAGLWNERRGAGDETGAEFALLTTAANRHVAALHDRMPIALPKSTWRRWLSPQADAEKVLDLLHEPALSAQSRWFAHPVSSRVNRVGNDDPTLLQKVDPPAVNLSLF